MGGPSLNASRLAVARLQEELPVCSEVARPKEIGTPDLQIRSLTVRQRSRRSKERERLREPLCLSEIKHAHTDDEVRQEMA